MPGDTLRVALTLLSLVALALPAIAITLQVIDSFADSYLLRLSGQSTPLRASSYEVGMVSVFFFVLAAWFLGLYLLVRLAFDAESALLVLLGLAVISVSVALLVFLYLLHNLYYIAGELSGREVTKLYERGRAAEELGVEKEAFLEDVDMDQIVEEAKQVEKEEESQQKRLIDRFITAFSNFLDRMFLYK